MNDETDVRHVALAVVVDGGRVLVGRRPAGGHLAGRTEFPGGKREEGEAIEACLVRELAEEVGLRLVESRPIPPPIRSRCGEQPVLLFPFLCTVRDPESVAPPWRWVERAELSGLDFPDANGPLLRFLASTP